MKKKALAILLTLCMAASLLPTAFAAGGTAAPSAKASQPRVIVTTDGECDDQNSLRHMALYFNDMDVAGLVYSSAEHHWEGDGVHKLSEIVSKWQCDGGNGGDYTVWRPAGTTWINEMIENEYAKDYVNLVKHDPNYPSPEELLAVTKVGNVLFEGDTRYETEGSNLIRDAILDDDPRLLYLQAWGGNNTIVRALLSIYETYHGTDQWNEIYHKVCSKVVFLKGMDQDCSWELNNMTEKFPDLMFMSTDINLGYFLANNADENVRPYFKPEFLTKNIKFNHGEMMSHYHLMGDGDVYPGEKDDMQYGLTTIIDWGFMKMEFEKYDWLAEGDSALWVPMIDVGLRGLESIDSNNYGTWAGRFSWTKANGEVIRSADLSKDYNYATGEMSNPGGGFFGGSTYSGGQFMEAFMLDWAARADWAVDAGANNPPVVTAAALDIAAKPGDVVSLDGSASDPDGDGLDIEWWVYEAGSNYSGSASNLRVWNKNQAATKFTVPKDAKAGDYFNLILEVSDLAGQYSSFTRYAQVIVKVTDESGNFPEEGKSQTAFPTNDALTVDGKAATPTVYKIDGANYFQLRDVAALLNGTEKQFEVGYDSVTNSVTITTGQAYTPNGKELAGAPMASAKANISNDKIIIDGVESSLTVYKINGANYFKIRDLAQALDFNVGWTQEQGMFIEGNRSYSPND